MILPQPYKDRTCVENWGKNENVRQKIQDVLYYGNMWIFSCKSDMCSLDDKLFTYKVNEFRYVTETDIQVIVKHAV